MKRVLLTSLCLALAAAGCSKKAEETPTPDTQAQAAPAAGGPSAPAAPEAPAPPRKIEINDELVVKYIEYQKAQIAMVQQFAVEAGKNLKAAEGSTLKTLGTISENSKLADALDQKLKAKRREMGFAEDEFQTLQEAAGMVANARALYNQMGGDAQVAKIEAEQKAQLAKLTGEQRTAAEAQVASMTKAFTDLKNGLDVRQKFGDQSADALLRHADELAKAYWEGLKSLK